MAKCNWLVADITKEVKTELAGYFCSKNEADKKRKQFYSDIKTTRTITKKQFKDLPQSETKFD